MKESIAAVSIFNKLGSAELLENLLLVLLHLQLAGVTT
jgi:hypothetical protein